ncbi:MAG: hypothetical protein M5U35_09450 [Roseovarius sp.]|nr:hypothetical protein [Roseovarius sp.]
MPKLEGGSFDRPREPGELPDPVNLPPGCPFAPRCPIAVARCRTERPELRRLANGTEAACHLAE